jgi:hypothetical protein
VSQYNDLNNGVALCSTVDKKLENYTRFIFILLSKELLILY